MKQKIGVAGIAVQQRKLELMVGQKKGLMLGMYVHQPGSQGIEKRQGYRLVVHESAGTA